MALGGFAANAWSGFKSQVEVATERGKQLVGDATQLTQNAVGAAADRTQQVLNVAGNTVGEMGGVAWRGTTSLAQAIFTSPETRVPKKTTPRDVFVIHGHDEVALSALVEQLCAWSLNPIVLKEEANELKTIKEKFESYAYKPTIGFAVALFTPDDHCICQKRDDRRGRARQNVVFELGFFMSSFHGKRACMIVKGDLELPSDIDGMGRIVMDEQGTWKEEFLTELVRAGMAPGGADAVERKKLRRASSAARSAGLGFPLRRKRTGAPAVG